MELVYPWNIIGHQKQLHSLEQDLQASNLAHAYLFCGPSQIGKFTIVKMLAKILQCEQNFCHTCSTCLEIKKGLHADTIEMADNGEALKIEKIRELLNRLHTTAQSRYKIVLLQNIERMTPESANALLKTLEDPPPKVKFLLTTGNIKALLATIVSRVRIYKFSNVPEAELELFLRKNYAEKSHHDIQMIIALALGKPGKALMLLRDAGLLKKYQEMYHELCGFMEKPDRVAQFAMATALTKKEGTKEIAEENFSVNLVEDFLNIFLAAARQYMLRTLYESSQPRLLSRWIRLMKEIQLVQEMLKRNVNARLALENLMLVL